MEEKNRSQAVKKLSPHETEKANIQPDASLDKQNGTEVKNKGGWIPLHWSTLKNNNLNIIEFLIKEASKFHTKDEYGNTLLHIAALNGELQAVKYLLDSGANLAAQD